MKHLRHCVSSTSNNFSQFTQELHEVRIKPTICPVVADQKL